MDVPVIEAPDVGQVQEQLDAYRKARRKRLARDVREEFELVERSLEHQAKGRRLLDLAAAFDYTGLVDLDEDGGHRPQLAIARADRKVCRVSWSGRRRELIFDASKNAGRQPVPRGSTLQIQVPVQEWMQPPQVRVTYPDDQGVERFSHWRDTWRPGFALVPMIPAKVRLEIPPGEDRKRFILWEVDGWSDTRDMADADLDPFLLEHVAGDLYAILAAWGLTEVERMAMTGRREGV